MELLLGQCVLVDGDFRFLLLRLLLDRLVIVVARLALSAFTWLSIIVKVFSDESRKFVCVNTRTQDLAHLHEDLAVFILGAELGISL